MINAFFLHKSVYSVLGIIKKIFIHENLTFQKLIVYKLWQKAEVCDFKNGGGGGGINHGFHAGIFVKRFGDLVDWHIPLSGAVNRTARLRLVFNKMDKELKAG